MNYFPTKHCKNSSNAFGNSSRNKVTICVNLVHCMDENAKNTDTVTHLMIQKFN